MGNLRLGILAVLLAEQSRFDDFWVSQKKTVRGRTTTETDDWAKTKKLLKRRERARNLKRTRPRNHS